MANALILKPATPAAVASSSTAAGYRASNTASDRKGLVWRSATGSSSQTLTFDLGEDTGVDSIILFGLYGAQASWQWAVDLATDAQGNFTGSYWSGSAEDLLAGSAMPADGLGKALWQAPAGAPAAARYVRLNFSGLASAAVEVSRAVIGAKFQPARNYRFGAALGVRPLGTLDFSIRGVVLRRRGVKLRGIGLSFFHVHRDELEEQLQPLLEWAGNDEFLAVVTDPAAHEQRQSRIYGGFLTGNIGSIFARPGGFQAEINLVSLF
ncbi:MAG: hypothetical protein AB7G24_00760 [Novosphingobium sp.]